ncbi:MAG: DUF4340 domain-containing protein [Lachnospiraceae bacterium]
MQKQKKQLIVVVILLLVCVGAYFGLQQYNKAQKAKEKEEEAAATITLTDFDVEDVSAFSYPVNGKTLSFTKTEDGDWTCDKDPSVDVDENKIKSMLEAAQNLTAEEKIESSDDSELKEYGFSDDSTQLTFTVKDETLTLILGEQNAVTQQYYIKTADSDDVYLITSDLSTSFTEKLKDLEAEDTSASDTSEASESSDQ